MPKSLIRLLLRRRYTTGALFSVFLSCFFIVPTIPLYAGLIDVQPKPHDSYEIKEGKIYFRKGNAGLILEGATPEKIAKYYAERGSNLTNPFANIGDETLPAAIFLVTLLNRTNGNATFTPGYVTMKIKTEAYFPLDFTMLLEFTEDTTSDFRKIIEKSVFSQPELISPGSVVTKFLIYPALPKKIGDFRLEFDYMFFESKELRPHFYFTKVK